MADQPVTMLEPLAAYALWAGSYPARAHNPLMRAEERALLSLLPADLSGQTVLDAGCGSGRYVLHALRRGAARVIGVDQSAEMLQRAHAELGAARRGPDRVELICAELVALPLANGAADVTICALTVGHLTSLEATLAELRRVTRPGGLIVCSDFHPLAHARGWRREFTSAGRRYAVRHTVFTREDWRAACHAQGLTVARVLEPCLDPADLVGERLPDPAVLEVPAVILWQLSHAGAEGGA